MTKHLDHTKYEILHSHVGTVPDPLVAPVVRNIRIVLSKMFCIIFFCNQANNKHNMDDNYRYYIKRELGSHSDIIVSIS
jgi:hypothetical protein